MEDEKKSNKGIIAILLIIIVALACAVVYFIINNGKENDNSKSNSNQTSNSQINSNSNSEQIDYVSLGKEKYELAKNYYSDLMNPECEKEETVNGKKYCNETILYNNLKKTFSSTNKASRFSTSPKESVFSNFIQNGDNYYLVLVGGGFNGEVTNTTLTVKSQDDNKIVYEVVSTIKDVDGNIKEEKNDFVLVKEDNEWKVDEFVGVGL